jgi:hypothetical protein
MKFMGEMKLYVFSSLGMMGYKDAEMKTLLRNGKTKMTHREWAENRTSWFPLILPKEMCSKLKEETVGMESQFASPKELYSLRSSEV